MNRETLKVIQGKFLEGKGSISFSEMERLGIKDTEKIVVVGNLRLKRNEFLEYYSISLIDEENDLDGLPIRENRRLFQRLEALWEEGKDEIGFEELKKLNIYTPKSTLLLKNFRLNNFHVLAITRDSYSISLIEDDKDPQGKWIDEATNVDRVLIELKTFMASPATRQREAAVEKELFAFFRDRFHSVQRQVYIGGGVKALKIDFDFANGRVGLELKLAESLLNSTEKQRLIGQMHDYTTKRYKPENFILVVAGVAPLRSDPTISEIRSLVKAKSHFHYINLD